jgi:hypothetical protein
MLKCLECANLVNGSREEGPIGGGCDNVIHCAVRPEIEEMVRKELRYYGSSGSPSWLCGQTAIDEMPSAPNEKDQWEAQVEELRDPAWEAWDEWIATLPKMRISRVRDRRTGKVVLAYLKDSYRNEWMLRREESIAEDVLWRAQRGGCDLYERREFEDDEVLQAHYENEVLQEDEELERTERWFQMMEAADIPLMLAEGHLHPPVQDISSILTAIAA